MNISKATSRQPTAVVQAILELKSPAQFMADNSQISSWHRPAPRASRRARRRPRPGVAAGRPPHRPAPRRASSSAAWDSPGTPRPPPRWPWVPALPTAARREGRRHAGRPRKRPARDSLSGSNWLLKCPLVRPKGQTSHPFHVSNVWSQVVPASALARFLTATSDEALLLCYFMAVACM